MTTDQKLDKILHNIMGRVDIRALFALAEIHSMAERDRRSLGQKFRHLLKGAK